MDTSKIVQLLERNLPNLCKQLVRFKPDNFWDSLLKFIGNNRLVFIGEAHGTREIPKLTVEILRECRKLGFEFFAMEVPRINMKYLDKLLRRNRLNDLRKLPMYLRTTEFQDGRSTHDHMKLIFEAHKLGYKIGFFDMNPWENETAEVTRSLFMANNFRDMWIKAGRPKSIIFSAHLHGHPSWFEHKKERSMRWNILNLEKGTGLKVVSIFVMHGRGSFWNNGLQEESHNPIGILVDKIKPNLKHGFFDMRPDMRRYEYILEAFGEPIPFAEGMIYLRSVSPAQLPKLGLSLYARRLWHLVKKETI